MKKRILSGERGDFSYYTIFMILAVNMVLGFLLLYVSARINCINIRNAAKMELNNVSARIYADTFHSQREANLNSYMNDLSLSASYQSSLRAGFISGLQRRIELSNDSYELSNIALDFTEHADRIEYVMTCDASFRVRMFGNLFPPIVTHIRLTGSHHTKY